MSGDKRTRLKEWLDSGAVRLEPLSFPQRELWEASPLPPADVANHISCLINVRGAITAHDCEVAIQRVVARQEVLRLSFLPGKGGAVQMIRATGDANFRFRELSPAAAAPEALEELGREIFSAPFDLMQGPLFRVELLRRAANDHVLAFAIHHAIADGWTLGVFVQDLCGAYMQGLMGDDGELPPVPLTYSAWGASERAFWQPAELELRAAFWRKRLADRPRLWPASGVADVAQRWVATLPADLGRATRELAKKSGVTLFNTLLTAFQIALWRWSGAEDIVVGTPVANRARQAVRETMGYCSGVVPLRGRVVPERTFSAMVCEAQQTTAECFAEAMPFAELARALGEAPAPGRNPVFEMRFALQNHPIPDVDLPGLSARLQMRSTGTPRFTLACELTEQGESLEVAWLFRPPTFSLADAQTLDGIFRTVLAAACRAPESRVAALAHCPP